MMAALILVATFDVVFAADSIPAIFAITGDTFVVYAANAFSLLGLPPLLRPRRDGGPIPLPERGTGSRAHLRWPEDGALGRLQGASVRLPGGDRRAAGRRGRGVNPAPSTRPRMWKLMSSRFRYSTR